jgi:hypothetical protein
VRLQDYDGPLQKTVGLFARELERKSVHPPRYKPGLMLCSLDLTDKFILFARDTFNPVTFIASGFFAGLDQAQNRDPSFGQGGAGYAKRFGASFVDQTSSKFFLDFVYPTIFSEDPFVGRRRGRQQRWGVRRGAVEGPRDERLSLGRRLGGRQVPYASDHGLATQGQRLDEARFATRRPFRPVPRDDE